MTDVSASQESRNLLAPRHGSSQPARSRLRSVMSGVLIVALAAVLGPTASAGIEAGTGEPAIGYWTDTNVVVADGDGVQIGAFPDFERFSLNGSVIAGERAGRKPTIDRRVVVFDVASGERLFRIRDAMTPVVTAGGRKIAFHPTARREDFVDSVWLRNAAGRVRRIIHFTGGPGDPGVRHGMKAGLVLDSAFDERGRTMAVVFGNEGLRVFDVWVVDVRTRRVTRLTRSNHSSSPSVSPDGSKVAVRVESAEGCFSELYGEYFTGKIRVISPSTGERRTVTRFDCDLFYGDPRWIDNDSLITQRITKDRSEETGFDLDIVRIDISAGEVTEVVTEGNPCCFTVSPSSGKVAYEFTDRPGFGVYDVATSTVLNYPEGNYVPHLAGENRFCC